MRRSGMKDNFKISIVTVCYNSERTIFDTLKTVKNQSYKNIEHIIVDGMSDDETMTIVKSFISQYSHISYKVVSEKDKGIYDAMNKGIALATGDVLGILNSDDLLSDNNVLSDIILQFEQKGVDSLYADIEFVNQEATRIIRKWESSAFKQGSFKRGWHPPHPSFYVKKSIYDRYGGFNIDLNISADFELMLRFLERYCISTTYMPRTIVKMRYGGESTGSIKSIIEGNKNVMKAFWINGIPVSRLYPIYRLLPKIIQFIKRS